MSEKSTIFSCKTYLENWENTFARRENKIGCLQQHFHSRNNSDVFYHDLSKFYTLQKAECSNCLFFFLSFEIEVKSFSEEIEFLTFDGL